MSDFFSVETRDGCLIITMQKEFGSKGIEMATVASIQDDLLECITSSTAPVVIIVLTLFASISSAMVGMIVMVKRRQSAKQFRCVFSQGGVVQTVFRTTQMEKFIDCYTSLKDALVAQKGAQ